MARHVLMHPARHTQRPTACATVAPDTQRSGEYTHMAHDNRRDRQQQQQQQQTAMAAAITAAADTAAAVPAAAAVPETAPAAAAAAPQPTAAPSAPASQYHVVFMAVEAKAEPAAGAPAARKSSTVMLCQASIFGCLPGPLALSGWGIGRDDRREMRVYVPSAARGFYKHVEPGKIKLAAPMIVDGRRVEYQDDPDGVAALEHITDALLDAWAEANRGGVTRWGVRIPLAI